MRYSVGNGRFIFSLFDVLLLFLAYFYALSIATVLE